MVAFSGFALSIPVHHDENDGPGRCRRGRLVRDNSSERVSQIEKYSLLDFPIVLLVDARPWAVVPHHLTIELSGYEPLAVLFDGERCVQRIGDGHPAAHVVRGHGATLADLCRLGIRYQHFYSVCGL